MLATPLQCVGVSFESDVYHRMTFIHTSAGISRCLHFVGLPTFGDYVGNCLAYYVVGDNTGMQLGFVGLDLYYPCGVPLGTTS